MHSEIQLPGSTPQKRRNPWLWIPSLYYAEGIPFIIITAVSVIMYKRLGISNIDIAFYTSWLYLPWVIKPFWSPLLEIFRTKRLWIISTQFVMGAGFACVALTLPMADFFRMSIAVLWLMAFNSATHDISADGFYMLALDEEEQAWFVGIRSTFYRIAMLSGQGLFVMLAGYLERTLAQNQLAWAIVFAALSFLFLLLASYHFFILPKPPADCSHHEGRGGAVVFHEFTGIVKSFFMKDGIWGAIAFLLLYRLGEAQLVKMCAPFLMDSREIGGLALSTEQVGIVYGTSGTIMMIIGGILGGILIARFGLKRCLWPMVFAIHIPDLLYVYLAYALPSSIWLTGALVALEQFGYGLGFTAYMMFMVYFAEGEYKTAHFAIMTGLMAMGMMVPGMFSGDIQAKLGYLGFFIWVCFATIPSFLAVFFVKVRR